MGQLARFDLHGEDVVEVFELGGGDGAGDDGGRSDEVGEFEARGGGGGYEGEGAGGVQVRGRWYGDWRTLTLEVSCCSQSVRAGYRTGRAASRLLQEPQAEGDGDCGFGLGVEGVKGGGPRAIGKG